MQSEICFKDIFCSDLSSSELVQLCLGSWSSVLAFVELFASPFDSTFHASSLIMTTRAHQGLLAVCFFFILFFLILFPIEEIWQLFCTLLAFWECQCAFSTPISLHSYFNSIFLWHGILDNFLTWYLPGQQGRRAIMSSILDPALNLSFLHLYRIISYLFCIDRIAHMIFNPLS